jgi:A/G-specific adenine glycosylase
MSNPLFSQRLLSWFHQHGRKKLPWQKDLSPYPVWVSEIMLQQTQVKTVIPYFERFMARFPTLQSLAAASQDEVLSLWSGLGYYARGRNLHKTAQIIDAYQGHFPTELTALQALPGLGRSTASAILAICFGTQHAILDGNVKRVLTRYLGIEGYPGEREIEARLWQKAEDLLPTEKKDIPAYTQAIMDLGAMICLPKNPNCLLCPVKVQCRALQNDQIHMLPTPKPKRAYPTKKAWFVILKSADSIHLIQRPQIGIWGGLWCPPEFPDLASTHAYLNGLGLDPKEATTLPQRHHLFTHYRLEFTPLFVQWRAPICHDKLNWTPLHKISEKGLPAPMSRLIASA